VVVGEALLAVSAVARVLERHRLAPTGALEAHLGAALVGTFPRLLAIGARQEGAGVQLARRPAADVADLREEGVGGGHRPDLDLGGVGSRGGLGHEHQLAGEGPHHVDVVVEPFGVGPGAGREHLREWTAGRKGGGGLRRSGLRSRSSGERGDGQGEGQDGVAGVAHGTGPPVASVHAGFGRIVIRNIRRTSHGKSTEARKRRRVPPRVVSRVSTRRSNQPRPSRRSPGAAGASPGPRSRSMATGRSCPSPAARRISPTGTSRKPVRPIRWAVTFSTDSSARARSRTKETRATAEGRVWARRYWAPTANRGPEAFSRRHPRPSWSTWMPAPPSRRRPRSVSTWRKARAAWVPTSSAQVEAR